MDANPLPNTPPLAPGIQSGAEYEATVVRFWKSVDHSTVWTSLLALRDYERAHPN